MYSPGPRELLELKRSFLAGDLKLYDALLPSTDLETLEY